MKKEDELSYWRRHATPEDVEYFECQLELQQDLLKSYNVVERIIGNLFFSLALAQTFNSLLFQLSTLSLRQELQTISSSGRISHTPRPLGKRALSLRKSGPRS